jgi:hypothetical protein
MNNRVIGYWIGRFWRSITNQLPDYPITQLSNYPIIQC